MKESKEANLFALHKLRKARVHGKTKKKKSFVVSQHKNSNPEISPQLYTARVMRNLKIFASVYIHIHNNEFSIWRVNSK